MNENELLARYAREDSQEAFAELVRRHLDLVYSAALRQVRSPQLAEEVAQSVFLDLARNAGRLRPDTRLGAWLYAVTRRTAIDVIRRESRRQTRERAAAEHAAPGAPPWLRVEDLLDEAMASLREADRQAVLLRYFQGRSLREVGSALAISEDTAQKRISRAIEKLQGYFSEQGVTVGSAALVGGLSQHAVRIAPAALATRILSEAAKGGWSSATLATSKGIAAGLLQKASFATATLAISAGLFESGSWVLQARTLRSAQSQREALEAAAARASAEDSAAANRLRAAETDLDQLLADAQPGSDAALEARMNKWLGQISRLKATLVQRPDLSIPQLRYLIDRDWLAAASGINLDSDDSVRRALANLRSKAQARMAIKLQAALSRYVQANAGMPTDLFQLAPFFDEPIAADVLEQYAVKPNPFQNKAHPSATVIAIKAPADLAYDQYWQLGIDMTSIGSALGQDVTVAQRQYAKANNGATTQDPDLLQPYLLWPADPDLIRGWFAKNSAPRK